MVEWLKCYTCPPDLYIAMFDAHNFNDSYIKEENIEVKI